VPFIDWTPFFSSWQLAGSYPAILQDDLIGEAATNLFNDAQKMLEKLVAEKWIKARAVIGFWPANQIGDDVAIFDDETCQNQIATFHTLRQQMQKDSSKPNFALSDYIAPIGMNDYIGGFAVTSGIGEVNKAEEFKANNDDYSAILFQSLCDRLAEALAEHIHYRVRKEFWAYAPDENLSVKDIIGEKYRGIRPAAGYPAQPDHTEKLTLFKLLDATKNTGIELTTSMAMNPPSSVSGLYFAHNSSEYFGVGRIEKDQVEDYANRKNWDIKTCERWLAPILNYDA